MSGNNAREKWEWISQAVFSFFLFFLTLLTGANSPYTWKTSFIRDQDTTGVKYVKLRIPQHWVDFCLTDGWDDQREVLVKERKRDGEKLNNQCKQCKETCCITECTNEQIAKTMEINLFLSHLKRRNKCFFTLKS